MKPLTRAWIDKAEGDFTAMEREYRARKTPVHDAVCFHAQQCVEKYLKARLQEASARFPRTHDLEILLGLVLPIEPLWEFDRREFKWLTSCAVEVRYPGETADKDDARRAAKFAREIRKTVREAMNLD